MSKIEIFMPSGQPYQMCEIIYWDDSNRYIIVEDDQGTNLVCTLKMGAWCAISSMDIIMYMKRLERIEKTLSEIKWKSIDKDNMEFRATISCYQKDKLYG